MYIYILINIGPGHLGWEILPGRSCPGPWVPGPGAHAAAAWAHGPGPIPGKISQARSPAKVS